MESKSTSDPNPFADQVEVEDVVRILSLIASPPNRRESPLPNDPPGTFDFWFDGGVCTYVTGCTEYEFDDGTTASIAVLRELTLSITFPDGRSVAVKQTKTIRSGTP